MGYQITWKVKDLPELDPRFKTQWDDIKELENIVQEYRLSLLIEALNLNKSSNSSSIKELRLKFTMYKILLQEKWKFDLQEKLKEEEIWFCGWEYSKDESVEDSTTEFDNLCILSLTTKEADPIEDSSYFDEKSLKITEILDSLEDSVHYELSHQFVDMYREYQINDNETD